MMTGRFTCCRGVQFSATGPTQLSINNSNKTCVLPSGPGLCVAKCFDSCSLYKYKFYVCLRRRCLLSVCSSISYKLCRVALFHASSGFNHAFYDTFLFLVVIVHACRGSTLIPNLSCAVSSICPFRTWHPAAFRSRPEFWQRIGGRRCSRWPCTSPCTLTSSSALQRTKMRLALGYTYRSSAR